MIYYSPSGKVLDTNNYEHFAEGGTATILKKDNILFKQYSHDRFYNTEIKKNNFEYFKKSNVPNLVKLLDIYYSSKDYINKFLIADGYTMEEVPVDDTKLITADREYIIMLLKQLEDTLKTLSDKKIVIEDLHEKNIIFNSNGVSIIDIDEFMRNPILVKRYVYYINKCSILYTMSNIIYNEYAKKNDLRRIIPIRTQKDTSITEDFFEFFKDETLEDTIKKYNLKK